jgi:hypothetical protein
VLDSLRVARRIHDLLGRERPGRWVVLILISVVASGFEMLGAVSIYALLALLTAPATVMTVPFVGGLLGLIPTDDVSTLRIVVGVAVLAFFVIRGGVIVTRAYIESRLVTAAGIEVADRLLAGYLAMPYRIHTQRNTAELVRNAFTSTDQLQRAGRPVDDAGGRPRTGSGGYRIGRAAAPCCGQRAAAGRTGGARAVQPSDGPVRKGTVGADPAAVPWRADQSRDAVGYQSQHAPQEAQTIWFGAV